MKLVIRLAVLAGILFMVWRFAVPVYAEWRIRSALTETGMSEKGADCTARRIARRLSPPQLANLQALDGEKERLGDWVNAVEQIDDREVIVVATTSLALCSTGLAR
ncbi:hypothetical protein GCM10011494_01850 [Novosphingobium endophyticum]|uniref:Uncharacterized protein n=1 Tax=Novosphingobium endophyticum TaxID=1955250 RepID=A0A916TP28_9SPHN|nr:hypothetical protein [Novosphingobium endophyticum]GGB87138.1 hypothetical protein GCM10011494_01850 [Novosphingobium endophyticum]